MSQFKLLFEATSKWAPMPSKENHASWYNLSEGVVKRDGENETYRARPGWPEEKPAAPAAKQKPTGFETRIKNLAKAANVSETEVLNIYTDEHEKAQHIDKSRRAQFIWAAVKRRLGV
jgi:hypothetical protein